MPKKKADISLDDLLVPVGELAQFIGHDPVTKKTISGRRIQQLAEAGIVHRSAQGKYRLKRSVQGYVHDLHSKLDGKDLEYNRERTEAMKLRRQKAELELKAAEGTFVNRSEERQKIERVLSFIRQRELSAGKFLAPRLEGMSAGEIADAIDDYNRSTLTQAAALVVDALGDSRSAAGPSAAAQAGHEPVGGPEKKAQR